ncbi:hypothetical protein EHZ19_29560, partial [Paraburkholderia bannensis]
PAHEPHPNTASRWASLPCFRFPYFKSPVTAKIQSLLHFRGGSLARRLAIALWRFLEHGEIPEGAILKSGAVKIVTV